MENKEILERISEELLDWLNDNEKSIVNKLLLSKKWKISSILEKRIDDITEKHTLLETEERLAAIYAILENLPYFAAFTIDRWWNVSYVSPTMYNISWDIEHKLFNSNIFSLPSYKDCWVLDKVETAFKTWSPQYINNIEFTSFYWRKTTRRNFTILPYHKQDSYMAIIFVEDITEKTALEEKLRQSQKLETIWYFTRWVAHNFNNIFTIIRWEAEMMQLIYKLDYPNISKIVSAVDRWAKLSYDLLSFTRDDSLTPVTYNLWEYVSHFITRNTRELENNKIKVDLQISEDAPFSSIDNNHFDLVLSNIVNNAIDAMPDWGILSISVRTESINRVRAKLMKLDNYGKYSVISICDNWKWMTEEIVQKVFDPFFTTKDIGKWTWLGLSIAYWTVKKLWWEIIVKSAPWEWSKFEIFLPYKKTNNYIQKSSK